MNQRSRGFVISAILYPLLVLFLALIMGLLAMSDTRKRILDKMKLEISDSIFDDAECSCDTILNKLNYIIKNGVGGGGGGSYSHNVLGLNVKGYETEEDLPNTGNSIGDIGIITDVEVTSYYVSRTAPSDPKEGNVWIVEDRHSDYYIKSDYSNIGISYAMQYIENKWILKKSYVFDDAKWKLLYYVSLKGDGVVDLTNTDINAKTEWIFNYTGKYQPFTAIFSGYYQIELWGAKGGYSYGGNGAYTRGQIYLDAGETLYVYVGQQPTNATGGWNGGGNGTTYGYGGGGATDVRLEPTTAKTVWNEFESLKSRIMIAAGGGGADYYNGTAYGYGGAGGTLSGGTGSDAYDGNTPGTGAGQSFPGYMYEAPTTNVGTFALGAGATQGSYGGGGGGGGYYGGGGGHNSGGGGGGSSYISGNENCNSLDETATSTSVIHNGSIYHYSDKYFIYTTMSSGANAGNGKAVIKLITVEVKKEQEILELKDNSLKWSYTYSGDNLSNGRYQLFSVPKSGKYKVELWGAQGGFSLKAGGTGAYTSGEIYLTKGTTLYVYVGGNTRTATGGWNGGGNGTTYAGGGGGATDIRTKGTSGVHVWNEFESLKSRIMVASGGGGADYFNGTAYGNGGVGGALTGGTGSDAYDGNTPGTGGRQAFPGSRYTESTANVGSFGIGANGTTGSYGGAGGGGGYYGGGGGYNSGGGGGGSSYISGYDGCDSIAEESTTTNIIHNGSIYHYSGYYFESPLIYNGSNNFVPSQTSATTQTGNSGNGYARITFVGSETKTVNQLKNDILNREDKWYYSYSGVNLNTGRYQIFNAPKSGTYSIQLWGAQGGFLSRAGGLGAYTYGEIYLNKGASLYIYIGGTTWTATSGWNGGGNGTTYAGGGGGASDVRVNIATTLTAWNETDSLKSRIMVAAGGGGADYYNGTAYGNPGAAGGLNGYTGTDAYDGNTPGTGATQIAGGYRYGTSTANVGSFGIGANGTTGSYGGAGGGGGWYGGGGGYNSAGGGGGSSYISGHAGCIGINLNGEKLSASYAKLSDSYSFTDYVFVNTQIVDGAGYPWTTSKSISASGQPTNDGTGTQTGQSGPGYGKITYLGA